MTTAPFPVLYEDNHLLVVSKPAGLPTMGVAADKPSLLEIARQYVKEKYQKPGKAYLGIVSRLDAPVTGVVLMARTSKAAARLSEQFRERRVEKTYWTVIAGVLDPPEGTCVDWLRKDERHRRVHVTNRDASGAQEARLAYRTLQTVRGGTLLEIELETGRKHQIRVQLAHLGHSIIGDRKYGSRVELPVGIALHSRRLKFAHPVGGAEIELVAPLPEVWGRFGIDA
jgi:23S rRNA pseudouridine1911/1915/1917 synthase